jgi:hypothetical protein
MGRHSPHANGPPRRRAGSQGQKEETMMLQQVPVIGFTTTVAGLCAREAGRPLGANRRGVKSGHAREGQDDYPNVVDCLAAVFIVASVAFGPMMTWLILG